MKALSLVEFKTKFVFKQVTHKGFLIFVELSAKHCERNIDFYSTLPLPILIGWFLNRLKAYEEQLARLSHSSESEDETEKGDDEEDDDMEDEEEEESETGSEEEEEVVDDVEEEKR